MKRAALYSGILHVTLLLFVLLGLPNITQRTLAEQKPLMVEFVNIADFSQAPVLAPQDVQEPDLSPEEAPQETPAPQQPEPAPALPEPTPPPPAPEPPKPEPTPPEQKVEEAPEPILMPEVTEKEKPKIEKKPEPKVESKKPEPKKDDKKKEKDKEKKKEKVELNLDPNKKKEQKKKDDADKKKKVNDDFSDLLDDLTKEDKPSKKTSKSSGKTKGAPADRVGDVVTGTEIDAIRRQISRCWIVPQGARGAKDLAVRVDLTISRDGTVLNATLPDRGRLADPTYRAAAEAAQRAAMDPQCSPLPLNPKNYEQWKEMRLSFDPRDMY